MKIKITLLFMVLLTFSKVRGQTIEDTAHYDYAILSQYCQRGLLDSKNHLDVYFSNNKNIDLIKVLHIDTMTEYQIIFKGLAMMEKFGYELVSSNSHAQSYAPVVREYLFRKRKK